MSGGDQPTTSATPAGELSDLEARVYRRGTDEFARFTGFSDGIFGFAMTLLISTVAVPEVARSELNGALLEQIPDLFAFGVGFAVIGFYWLSHHRFLALVDWVGPTLTHLNLVLLALIAFLPFPTAILGRYEDAPVSVVVFASALAAASIVEVTMIGAARRAGALRVPLPPAAWRHVVRAGVAPVAVFALSIPIAFVDSSSAPLVWLLIWPVGAVIGRRSPPEARMFS